MRTLVGVLIRLHPRSFREARAAEVVAFVEAEAMRAARRGPVALAVFWVRTVIDLLGSAVRLRLRPAGSGPWAPGPWWRGTAALTDLRDAGRALTSTPMVSALVVVTLGLAVGMTTSVFSVVDAVLLRPLDYREPERLVHVIGEVQAENGLRALFSGGELADVRNGVSALEAASGVGFIRQNLTGAGLPRQVGIGWASGNLFQLLGVQAALGRTFNATDHPGTVVLGYELWRDQFGRDPDVVGRSIRLDGHPHTVVGVLPLGFRLQIASFPSADVALWKNPDAFWQNGDIWNAQGPSFGLLRIVGRLADGTGIEAVREQLSVLQEDLRRRFPEYEESGLTLSAAPLRDDLVADVRSTLLLLLAAVGVVLLVACANVMGLMLVRARRRRRDLAVRQALGATRRRLFRILLGESAILAALGGGAGAALAVGGTRLMERLGPELPRAGSVQVDARVLVFGLAVSVLVTGLTGLVPALRGSRADPAGELRSLRSTPEGASGLLRNGLVVGQIALSLVLLVATGLLTTSLMRMQAAEIGFRPQGILTFEVSLPGARYGWPEESGRFLLQLEDRIRELPGVEAAGVMWPIPFSGSRWMSAYTAGRVDEDAQALADYRVGTAGYFETLGIALQEGRLTGEGDPRESVVISRRVAERAWPGESALGRTVRANPWGGQPVEFEVVGVVDDVRYADPREEPPGALYFDLRNWSWTDWEFDVVVRAAGPPTALVPAVRKILSDLDPEIPLASPTTLEALVDAKLAGVRFALTLVALFGLVAGVLALVGVYGVISYAAGRRSRELAVRIAVGAGRSGIARLVLGHGLRLTVAGLAAGILGGAVASRLLESWLYQVEGTDPGTYAAAALLLGILALAATGVPAWRTSRLDPMKVLRTE